MAIFLKIRKNLTINLDNVVEYEQEESRNSEDNDIDFIRFRLIDGKDVILKEYTMEEFEKILERLPYHITLIDVNKEKNNNDNLPF